MSSEEIHKLSRITQLVNGTDSTQIQVYMKKKKSLCLKYSTVLSTNLLSVGYILKLRIFQFLRYNFCCNQAFLPFACFAKLGTQNSVMREELLHSLLFMNVIFFFFAPQWVYFELVISFLKINVVRNKLSYSL